MKLQARWFQLNLRTILFLVTVLGLFFGFFLRPYQLQQQAIARMRKGGPHNFVWYTVGEWPSRDSFIRRCLPRRFFDKVRFVGFDQRDVEPEALAALGSLPYVDGVAFTHGDTTNIRVSSSIERQRESEGSSWSFRSRTTPRRNIAHIHSIPTFVKPQLVTSIQLSDSDASDSHIRSLAPLVFLAQLNLDNTEVTDEGISEIANFESLTELFLNETAITDEGLSKLATLPHLKTLWVCDTRVTDEGILHFAHHPTLRELYVSETNVTPEGVRKLSEANPSIFVVHRGSRGDRDAMELARVEWIRIRALIEESVERLCNEIEDVAENPGNENPNKESKAAAQVRNGFAAMEFFLERLENRPRVHERLVAFNRQEDRKLLLKLWQQERMTEVWPHVSRYFTGKTTRPRIDTIRMAR